MRSIVVLSTLLVTACGAKGTVGVTPFTPHVSGPVQVQLNDMWNQVFPSEAVILSDNRRFDVPSSVQVVGGSFAGLPTQQIRARIKLGGTCECEYFNYDNQGTSLSLQACYNFTSGDMLQAGTKIELENYDAPGLLLEAHFTLNQ